jgi:type III secretory pathway lipoprotein EscJ
MTGMVQAAVAGDVTEAGEIQALLTAVGIDSELQTEDEADALAVLVPESSLEAALDAIEAMTEPDELTSEP